MDPHAVASPSEPTPPREPPFWTHALPRVPWCQTLKANAEAIRAEVLPFIARFRPFMPYPKYANLYNNTWDAFPLSIFQGEHIELSRKNLSFNMAPLVASFRAQLPVTASLITELEQQGDLRNVFVSRLIPGSVINPHRGWTPDFLRIHLCLVEDPGCRMTVGDETVTWTEGELLAFKDGGPYLHQVQHQGQRERIVISFDLKLTYIAQFIPEILATENAARTDAA